MKLLAIVTFLIVSMVGVIHIAPGIWRRWEKLTFDYPRIHIVIGLIGLMLGLSHLFLFIFYL